MKNVVCVLFSDYCGIKLLVLVLYIQISIPFSITMIIVINVKCDNDRLFALDKN